MIIYDDVEKDDKESEDDDYIPSDKKGYEFFFFNKAEDGGLKPYKVMLVLVK